MNRKGVKSPLQREKLSDHKQPMKSDHVVLLARLLMLSMFWVGVGCRTKAPKPVPPPPPQINTIRVGDFQCDNAITAQAVRNVFIEVIGRNRLVKIIREGEADVLIEGTVTSGRAGSSTGSFGAGPNYAAGGSSAVAGEYVSGVTATAIRNGEILTSASWGQVIGKNAKIRPPEEVARNAADRLVDWLHRFGLREE